MMAVAVLCAVLIGCTPPPDLRGRVTKVDDSTPWPTLFTTAQLMQSSAQNPARSSTLTTSTGSLAARAAALRARARSLSGPVLDTASRRHLQAAVARHR